MGEGCSHNCKHCSEDKGNCVEFMLKPNEMSNIKKIIGVVSGKGGVGKSLVTSLMAVSMQRKGYKTAILDADITGPSIPKVFGLKGHPVGTKYGMHPIKSKGGTDVMSVNFLLDNETDPVVWRGPAIATIVKQFWTDVIWADEDFLFIDMPPGTSDVSLTVFQSIPVDGIIMVASPQELVGMIVGKAVKMAEAMSIPLLALVENMSYFECPDCGGKHEIFGESRVEKEAEDFYIPLTAKIPLNPKLAEAADKGEIENFQGDWLEDLANSLEKMLKE